MIIGPAKTVNQNQSYFHRTFRATITAKQLLEDYQKLGQWQYVARKHHVSHAYIIMARKMLGIFEKTITRGKQYGGLNSRHTKNRGKNKDRRGYIKVGRYHPENNKGYVTYEHVLVMEKHLGRTLEPRESVHHIDGNKSNNSLENLYLCNHSLHRKTDLSAQYLVYELYKKGIVDFDREKGIYYLK
jgi:hypothetical protein